MGGHKKVVLPRSEGWEQQGDAGQSITPDRVAELARHLKRAQHPRKQVVTELTKALTPGEEAEIEVVYANTVGSKLRLTEGLRVGDEVVFEGDFWLALSVLGQQEGISKRITPYVVLYWPSIEGVPAVLKTVRYAHLKRVTQCVCGRQFGKQSKFRKHLRWCDGEGGRIETRRTPKPDAFDGTDETPTEGPEVGQAQAGEIDTE